MLKLTQKIHIIDILVNKLQITCVNVLFQVIMRQRNFIILEVYTYTMTTFFKERDQYASFTTAYFHYPETRCHRHGCIYKRQHIVNGIIHLLLISDIRVAVLY